MLSAEEDGAIVSDVHRVGDHIATNRYDQERTQDIGEVRFHTLWGEADGAVRTEWGHHVFAPLPDGELAWPALDIRSWTDPESGEELDVVGDRILRTEGSSVDEVFSIWDAETPILSSGDDQGF